MVNFYILLLLFLLHARRCNARRAERTGNRAWGAESIQNLEKNGKRNCRQEIDWNKQDIDTVYVLYVYIYNIYIYIYLNNVYLQLLLCFPYTLSLTEVICFERPPHGHFLASGVGADSGSDRCIRCEVRFGCRDCGLKIKIKSSAPVSNETKTGWLGYIRGW